MILAIQALTGRVSEEAYQDAAEIAEAVIQWAEERATCRED